MPTSVFSREEEHGYLHVLLEVLLGVLLLRGVQGVLDGLEVQLGHGGAPTPHLRPGRKHEEGCADGGADHERRRCCRGAGRNIGLRKKGLCRNIVSELCVETFEFSAMQILSSEKCANHVGLENLI